MVAEYLPIIKVLSEEFELPQLGKRRRIAALLPWDYNESGKQYPVLYLQDGQNLFDYRSPFGNWHVDHRLSDMALSGKNEVIVVAIDHGDTERVQEYSPPEVTRFGVSFGKQYARFLAETLKPYIDSHFRTLPDRNNTGIGGSSMGGLISIYCGLIYPEIYGKMMIFSPALWIAPKIYFQATNFRNSYETKIYLYGGGQESDTMIPNIERLKSVLERHGYDGAKIRFKFTIDSHGQHNEDRWGREFPSAVEWLYFEE
jgi:predicted alpha/beta superfamily hydrolase